MEQPPAPRCRPFHLLQKCPYPLGSLSLCVQPLATIDQRCLVQNPMYLEANRIQYFEYGFFHLAECIWDSFRCCGYQSCIPFYCKVVPWMSHGVYPFIKVHLNCLNLEKLWPKAAIIIQVQVLVIMSVHFSSKYLGLHFWVVQWLIGSFQITGHFSFPPAVYENSGRYMCSSAPAIIWYFYF